MLRRVHVPRETDAVGAPGQQLQQQLDPRAFERSLSAALERANRASGGTYSTIAQSGDSFQGKLELRREAQVFTEAGLEAAYRAGDGIPRLVNQICDHALVMACAAGGRSFQAAQFLAGQGYPQVANLNGGIGMWTAHGLPVRRGG